MNEAKSPVEIQAIGYEGDLPENCVLTWGAAALRAGDQLINAVSGRSLPLEQLDDFIDNRLVRLLSTPVDLPPDATERRLFVVVVRSCAPVRQVIHKALTSHALAVSEGECWSYVVENDGSLERMMEGACDAIVKHVQGLDLERSAGLIRCGLILDPFHPLLNALRVLSSPPAIRGNVIALARVCVKTPEGRLAFDDLLRARGINIDWDWSNVQPVRKN